MASTTSLSPGEEDGLCQRPQEKGCLPFIQQTLCAKHAHTHGPFQSSYNRPRSPFLAEDMEAQEDDTGQVTELGNHEITFVRRSHSHHGNKLTPYIWAREWAKGTRRSLPKASGRREAEGACGCVRRLCSAHDPECSVASPILSPHPPAPWTMGCPGVWGDARPWRVLPAAGPSLQLLAAGLGDDLPSDPRPALPLHRGNLSPALSVPLSFPSILLFH